MWLVMADALVGREADLEPAKIAFEATRGDFAVRFTAAVEALFARLVGPEVFIDIPEDPGKLTKAELDALVRPAAAGFLRAYPSKDELLEQAARIKRRQERRPARIPRTDRNGSPLPPVTGSAEAPDEIALRPRVVTSFPELGDVTIHLPADDDDRPELTMAPRGIGELEAVLHSVLAVAGDEGPRGDLRIDAQANEALVPEEMRWWSPESGQSEPARPVPAAQDPGVASELLATSTTLGGLPVDDNALAGADAMITALASVGDWRHSRHWLLDAWDPGDSIGVLATARAAVAGWADEDRSGVIVYVYGGALHGHEGLLPVPAPLHSYLLCVTYSATGQDTVDTVHRLILSCPGDNWCHRGGCVEVPFLEAAALLVPIVTAGQAADAATGDTDWAWDAYHRLYGTGDVDEYTDTVLDQLVAMLSSADWVELDRSTWEGGMQESLLRRGRHCLITSYDPVTRQIRLADGKPELESTLQLLADDGVLTGDDGQEVVDTSEDAVQRWGSDLLTAAVDLVSGHIDALPLVDGPVQGALLGLHPHADGRLSGPGATALAEGQLTALLRTIGVLRDSD